MFEREYKRNVSHRDSFIVQCQKCGCKKVSLVEGRATNSWEGNSLYLVCNHKDCGHREEIFWFKED